MDFDDSFDDACHRHLILLTRCCQLSQAGPGIGFIETGFIQDDWNSLEIAGGGVIDCCLATTSCFVIFLRLPSSLTAMPR
jgi:hypothetical protein